MKNITSKFCWITFGLFLSSATSAHAFSLGLNASVGEVFTNVNASSTVNTTATPNGFGNFFQAQDDPFTLLGSSSPNVTIPSGRNFLSPDTSIVLSDTFTLGTPGQGLKVEFDWSFQGNSTGLLGTLYDTFDVTLLGVGAGSSGLDIELLNTKIYQEQLNETITIPTGSLPIGNYQIQFSVIEPSVVPDVSSPDTLDNIRYDGSLISSQFDLSTDNSAAGIDNLDVSTVPFEFSPTLGILVVGGFWGLLFWKKHKVKLGKLK